MKVQGAYTALITPFTEEGRIDYASFEKLLQRQALAEISGVVVNGCTGEAGLLNDEETKELIYQAVRISNGSVPVIAGTGRNSTDDTITMCQFAQEIGADALMVITPTQVKPTQAGLVQHYMAVADSVEIPVMIYHIPGRTCSFINPETVAILSTHPNIAAIKEASCKLEQVEDIARLCDITILSGDDASTLPFLALGAKGVVSVAANVAPTAVRELVNFALGGHFDRARALHFELLPLFRALFLESNPIPVKALLELMGHASKRVRPPLTEATPRTIDQLRVIMDSLQVY